MSLTYEDGEGERQALAIRNSDLRSENLALRQEVERLRAEVVRLRAALALAVGEVSTYGPYLYTSPEQLMEYFMQEARREQ